MQRILSVLVTPFAVLNLVGGAASAFWLLSLNQWWAIGYAFAGLFFHSLLFLLMMPSRLATSGAQRFIQQDLITPGFVSVLLGQVYIYAVISVWCWFVFTAFSVRIEPNTLWPVLILSYSVAVGPLFLRTQKDQLTGSREAAAMTTVITQVAYVAIALIWALDHSLIFLGWGVFIGFMIVGVVAQTSVVFGHLKEDESEVRFKFEQRHEQFEGKSAQPPAMKTVPLSEVKLLYPTKPKKK